MNKPSITRLALIAVAICVVAAAAGPAAMGATANFNAQLPGVAVSGKLPAGWAHAAAASTPNKIILKGPNGETLTITLLPAAKGVDAAQADNLCKNKLADAARVANAGNRVTNGGSDGVYYSARTVVGAGDKAYAVGVAGNNVAGLLLEVSVPAAGISNIEGVIKGVVESLKITGR